MSKREDIFEKLDNLIEQNQFELVSDKVDDNRLKVIYLMNDAVESFIVFENARITGEYIKDYQGEINTSLTVQKMTVQEMMNMFWLYIRKIRCVLYFLRMLVWKLICMITEELHIFGLKVMNI